MKSIKAVDDLDRIKPRLFKLILELPTSTPSAAILYEFGINNLSIEILMEKVVHAVQTLQSDDNRIAKRLFSVLFEKKVPGFCTEVSEACNILGVCFEELVDKPDIRSYLKTRIVEMQGKQLLQQMLLSSKMDRVLLSGFSFDGKVMTYLRELDFVEARAVFMTRYRMLPTKSNFPGRWKGTACNICGFEDTDIHVLTCPGYSDLNTSRLSLDVFWDTEFLEDMKLLAPAAKTMVRIIARMEEIQNI